MTRRDSGQALTEFAFVLPLFMLFVFSVIQLSLLFVAYYLIPTKGDGGASDGS